MEIDLKTTIYEKIVQLRPSLAISSVKTYVSSLNSLVNKMNVKNPDIHFFSESEKIIEFLGENDKVSRKTIYSALFVLTGLQAYRENMLADCKKANSESVQQTKSVSEKENWVTYDDIMGVYSDLLNCVTSMLNQKKFHQKTIMEFLIIAFLGGVSGIIPRRSQDYAFMKIRNYDTKTDNYYLKGKMYFNIYKTHFKYGLQVVEVPKDLDLLLQKWVKLSTNDYMLYSTTDTQLSSPQITRLINSCFYGKHVSTDILRHVYLTNRFGSIPKLTELQSVARSMGHSLGQQMLYIKKD